MPIIELFCRKCQHKFEELILRKDESSKSKCPKCGSTSLQRLCSGFGFSIKGALRNSVIGSTCTSCSRTSCAECSK